MQTTEYPTRSAFGAIPGHGPTDPLSLAIFACGLLATWGASSIDVTFRYDARGCNGTAEWTR